MIRTLIDGVETDRLAVTDRGLQYGDGLFETLAVRDGGLCLWGDHFARLSRGAKRLGIPCPPQDLLLRECRQLIAGECAGVLKIVLTRGSGGRGYRPPEPAHPTRVCTLHPWPDYPTSWSERGVAAIYCRTPLGDSPVLAGLKHLNRLEQVLARSEWRDPQIAEGLMRDSRGRVVGGTMSNMFLVVKDRLSTPRLDRCGIKGTVRDLVLRLADSFGIEVTQTDIRPADIAAADGLFLTNALIGVWPVQRLGARTMGQERLPGELIATVRRLVWTPEEERRN
jgi:4-amino-4-deoxychorismate lyase